MGKEIFVRFHVACTGRILIIRDDFNCNSESLKHHQLTPGLFHWVAGNLLLKRFPAQHGNVS